MSDAATLIDPSRMSGLEMFREMLDRGGFRPPIAELMDLRLERVDHGYTLFRMPSARKLYNPLGTVHGGALATLLDSALGCAVHTTLAPGERYTTLEIKVNYVRAATEDSGLLTCEANVVHRGSRTATAEARITDEQGRLVAHGSTTCLIMAPGK